MVGHQRIGPHGERVMLLGTTHRRSQQAHVGLISKEGTPPRSIRIAYTLGEPRWEVPFVVTASAVFLTSKTATTTGSPHTYPFSVPPFALILPLFTRYEHGTVTVGAPGEVVDARIAQESTSGRTDYGERPSTTGR